jgi:hypothetical protein
VDRTRKTNKGLPRYCDGKGPDVFILSGADKVMTSKAAQAGPTANLRNGPTLASAQYVPGWDLKPIRVTSEGISTLGEAKG